MDTAIHVSQIIAAGFPEHMKTRWQDPLLVMVDHKRYGQKNGIGFYRYDVDPAGKPRKSPTPDSHALLKAVQPGCTRDSIEAGIVAPMLLPQVNAAGRCVGDRKADWDRQGVAGRVEDGDN